MKALCIKTPYIDWIIEGKKKYELRSWTTPYRGPLLLCVSMKPADGHPQHSTPGCIIGIATIIDIVKFSPEHADLAMSEWRPYLYAWELRMKYKVLNQVRVRGKLGLFNIPIPPTVNYFKLEMIDS